MERDHLGNTGGPRSSVFGNPESAEGWPWGAAGTSGATTVKPAAHPLVNEKLLLAAALPQCGRDAVCELNVPSGHLCSLYTVPPAPRHPV